MKAGRIKKQRLQEWFDAIRKHAHNQRELRIAKERLSENAALLYRRQFLLKWKARCEQTKKMRALCK